MLKTALCRRLPGRQLTALRASLPPVAGESRLACVRQLPSGALLLDWESGARQMAALGPGDIGAFPGEFFFLRGAGRKPGASRRPPRGFDLELFNRISGLFARYGILSAAALEQNDIGPVPGSAFRSLLTAPALSGRPKSISFDLGKSAALHIGDEECWFDVANHIEPFCLSYSGLSCDAFDPFAAPRTGHAYSAFKYRSEKLLFYPLRDRELLSGWDGLRKAAACAGRAARDGDGIVVDSGCLAQACGVNSSDIADGLRAEGGGFVALTTPVSRAAQPVIRAGAARAASRRNSVDFFNAEGDVFRSELERLCADLGLTVNSFCFPGYSRAEFSRYGGARLRAVFFSGRNPGAIKGLLGAAKPGVFLCDACFGPGQMTVLARSLAAAAGGGARRTARLPELLCPGVSGRISTLRRRLRGLRAAVVLDIGEFHLAVANWLPEFRLAVLAEGFYKGAEFEDAPIETSSRLKAVSVDTGIGLDFFLLARREPLPGFERGIARALETVFPGSRLRVFGSEPALYSALKKSGVRGVFSAYSFDDRVLACGKIPLDLESVGAGVLGALNGYETIARKMSAGIFTGGRP